jgi:hypothetical protein
MTGRRILALTAACQLVIAVTAASAQTVYLRHAGANATLEVVIDGMSVGSAPVQADGNAMVTATGDTPRMIDANVWVDSCGTRHRVVVSSRTVAPPPAEGDCQRAQINGLYLIQRSTTMVIDIGGTPTMLLRQGPAPEAWLRDPEPTVVRLATPLPPLVGLALFGGAGQSSSLDFSTISCGSVSECRTGRRPIPLTGGVTWWLKEWVGVEARYAHFGDQSVNGSGTGFRFSTAREGGLVAFGGRAGVRMGPRFRAFGSGGLTYHRATHSTTETIDDTTVTVDGQTRAVPGGTQLFQMRTRGWAPAYGGGLEFWLSERLGIYGEAQRTELKGTDEADTGLRHDDVLLTLHVGVTLRFP